MQKLRVRYAKRGRLRFTSHRDVARTFERALRRAEVPLAHSQGFTPHPKVSWVGAAPTGTASEAEYLELQLVEHVDAEWLRDALDVALPDGLDVVDVVVAGPGGFAERMEASRWRVELPGVEVEALRGATRALLAAERADVDRVTKDGRRTIDARGALVSAEVVDPRDDHPQAAALREQVSTANPHVDDWPKSPRPYGILVTVVRQTTPVVRPDDVLSALRVVADLVLPEPAKATRLAQGRLDDAGGLTDPLAQDRAAAEVRRG